VCVAGGGECATGSPHVQIEGDLPASLCCGLCSVWVVQQAVVVLDREGEKEGGRDGLSGRHQSLD
jgi:hypothetical protein